MLLCPDLFRVSLEPGESIEVVMTFAPESGGPATGDLVIQTDGSVSGGVYSLSGSGQRQEPDINIRVVNNNLGGVVASSGSAGPQVAGTVTNIGSQSLTVTSASIESEDSVFAVSAIGGPVTLQPGESLDISASFAPIVTGLQRATIVIESNDPDSPSAQLGLTGTGVAEFPGSLVEYGNDFVALITPASDLSPVLRSRTDDLGNWEFFLPPETIANFVTFDPVSGLVSAGGSLTSPAGEDSVMPTVPFAASVQPDFDGDGLPADIEFAIGTSDANQDSDGDGIDDFTAVLLGLDPLGALAIPTGIVSQLTLAGDAEAVAIGSSPANPDAIVAFVATGQSGFASVDISDPLMPVILAELNLPGQSSDLAVDLGNGRVYVAAGSAGVHVIDVSDPANPTLIQTISSPSGVSRIVLTEHGTFAVGNRELIAIDTGIGEVVAQLTVTGVALEAIAAEGVHVFVTDTSGSFAAVNVSQALVEGVMTVIGTMDAHRVRRLTVLDGVAFLAGEG